MKVSFIWSVLTEVEIPDAEIVNAIMGNSGNNIAKGDALATLATKYNAVPAEEGELDVVYQHQDGMMEAIWEN